MIFEEQKRNDSSSKIEGEVWRISQEMQELQNSLTQKKNNDHSYSLFLFLMIMQHFIQIRTGASDIFLIEKKGENRESKPLKTSIHPFIEKKNLLLLSFIINRKIDGWNIRRRRDCSV